MFKVYDKIKDAFSKHGETNRAIFEKRNVHF